MMDGLDLTPHEEELVTQTFAEIAPEVEKATEIFYGHLFEVLPETKTMFRDTEKRSEMFHILATAVKSLSYSGMAGPDLKALGSRHVTYEVTLEQFDVVGQVLMWTFEKILGEKFTPEARATWQKVYTAMQTGVTQGNYPAPPAVSEPSSSQIDEQAPRSGRRETPVVAITARGVSEMSSPQTGDLAQQSDDKTESLTGGPEQPSSDK